MALLAQSQELTSGVENDLLAVLVHADGSVGPYRNLTPWSGNQYRPEVAWDGTHFVVLYQDQKNRIAVQSLEQLDARGDLFGMRLRPDGTVVDPLGFLLSALPTAETHPDVAAHAGVSLLAGAQLVGDGLHNSYRIHYGLLDTRANQPPVAVAAADSASGDVPLSVSFSAAASTDPDGVVRAYAWDFGDGDSATEADPVHVYTEPGAYTATLTVTDDAGAATTQTVLVKAAAPNQPPVAVAEAVPASGPAPLAVVFHADGSYDPDGAIGNIHWSFSDGGDYWGSPAYHTFASEGLHTATLEVLDSLGAVSTTTVTISVGPTLNEPPTAAFAWSCVGLTCTFRDSSTDTDGTLTAWNWRFGDGFVELVPDPLPHTYPAAGSYQVSLTVRDDVGATATTTRVVTVTADGQPTSVHVGDLDGSARALTGGSWQAAVVVTVHDDFERPVGGATVTGRWSRGTRGLTSCVTNSGGICQLVAKAGAQASSASLRVSTVAHATLAYDAAGNHDADADSNGTTIVVSRPAVAP